MSTLSKKAWQSRAFDAEDAVERLRTATRDLIAQRDAWAALARAERRDHGVARFGTDAEKNAAFAQVQAARAALRVLGIDPDKEDGHDA
mgnify:CR=1 FL=1